MPGTDTKINYYLRPKKSIERKMFCHLLREINAVYPLREYRYIGMGAKYFVDFLVFYREFGFEKMISIEADSDNEKKYIFNKPLNCIKMEFGESGEVLSRLDWTDASHNFIWMDYDGYLQPSMLDDVNTILSEIKPRDLFFISFNSMLKEETPEKRYTKFTEDMGKYCPSNITVKDLVKKNKHKTMKRMFDNAIDSYVNTFNAAAPDDKKIYYEQLIFMVYADGAEMTTIGGIFLDADGKKKLSQLNLTLHMDFIRRDRDADKYTIDVPHLTYKEMSALFQMLPCNNGTRLEDIQEKVPGLQLEDIQQVEKLLRYYPFYIEATAFN